MRNATFGWRNLLLEAALTAGSQVADLGVGQMQNDQGSPATAWQTVSGVVTSWAQAQLVTAQPWGGFALARTNLTAAAQVRWRVGTDSAWTYDTGLVPAGIQPGYLQTVLVPPAIASGTRCRVDISDPTNPDGFLNVPLAYAGPVWTPARNIAWDSAPGSDSEVDEVVTRGGQEYPSLRFARRRWEISHQAILAAEVWTQLEELLRVARRGGNVLFVPDPDGADISRETVFGRLTSLSDRTFPFTTTELRAWRGKITERL